MGQRSNGIHEFMHTVTLYLYIIPVPAEHEFMRHSKFRSVNVSLHVVHVYDLYVE